MTDARAAVRVLDELLWFLRREGLSISTAQALDVARAVQAIGVDRANDVRDAIRSVVVVRASDRAAFDAAFHSYWALAGSGLRGSLSERLAARGFSPSELSRLDEAQSGLEREIPATGRLRALTERGADFDRLVARAGVVASIDAHSADRLGYLAHQLAATLGIGGARASLSALRAKLLDWLGVRGESLAASVARELDRSERDLREQVRRTHQARVAELDRLRAGHSLQDARLAELTHEQMLHARLAVRRLAESLRGGARVRSRRARRGPVDAHGTLRAAQRTGGVPIKLARRDTRRRRPKLILLCDISESVRHVASFLLEFAYAAQDMFDGTRTFVFVSDLAEITALFESERPAVAIERAWSVGGLHLADNSNYGRVLRTFVASHLNGIDRTTTVVILGDGRSNYHDPSPDLLDAIRARARALLWLCPEARGEWSRGDSAMRLYAPRCTATYEVCSVGDLERAARSLASPSAPRNFNPR